MKKIQINYCLINILIKPIKFFENNWFSKTIIKENQNNIKSSANTISDYFLREIIVLNIILSAKIKKVMIRKSGTTNYDNHYLKMNNTINISKLVQLLIEDSVFKEQLS